MGKHKRHYRKNYYNGGLTKKQQGEVFWSVVTVVVIWLLLWLLFWLGVGMLVAGLLYLVHTLNKTFNWYDTKFFYAPILSFSIASLLIISMGFQILHSLGKIDETFWDWAKEGSNYVGVKYTKGHAKVEPNVEGIAEKITNDSFVQPPAVNPPAEIQGTAQQHGGILGWFMNTMASFGRWLFGDFFTSFSSSR